MAARRSSSKSMLHRSKRRRNRAKRTGPLNLEALELRRLLAGVTVGNLSDLVDGDTSSITAIISSPGADGTVSLREAIAAANNTTGADTINFDASLSGGTITLGGTSLGSGEMLTIDASSLPDGVTIDANQQSRVFVNGSGESLTVRSLTITGGLATGRGAGVYSFYGDVALENATITGNNSGGNGGSVWTRFGNVTVNSSTVSGNTSGAVGGGIYASYGDVLVQDSTVTNNSAVSGGGIGFPNIVGGQLTIRNSIIAGNLADGAAADLAPPGNPSASLTVSFCLIGNNQGTTLTEAQTADANGNLIGGSVGGLIDAQLGSLADNGGPTRTHALSSGSPAIDAGNSVATTDQRGLTRPVDGPVVPDAPGSDGSDIGAFERQFEALSSMVTTNTDVVDDTDMMTSLREAIIFANQQAGADTITFDASLSGSTITLGGTQLESGETLTIDASSLPDGVTIDANQQSRVLFNGSGGSLTLRGLTVSGGSVSGRGAGVYSPYDHVLLDNAIITGNSSGGNGAGVSTHFGSVTVDRSTITGNSSGEGGGGIYTLDGNVTLKNSTVSGNSSGEDGGAVYTDDGDILIESSTITNNSAGRHGGGIGFRSDNHGESLTIRNSIVAGNTASADGTDFLSPAAPASNLAVSFSLIGTNVGTTLTESQTPNGNGNLIGGSVVGAIDPLLGPLTDNGGPTLTHELLPGSPAIDAGNSTSITDQRGLTRPADLDTVANAAGGNASDMGAFEQQVELPSLIVTTNTDVVTNTDFVTSLREAIIFANQQAGADTITFDASLSGGAITLSGTSLGSGEMLTIDASSLPDGLIIDANQQSRVLVNGSGDSLTVRGVTVTGGSAAGRGAGIYSFYGDVKLKDTVITGNSAGDDGGGVWTRFGNVVVDSSTISENTSGGDGGGISATYGGVTLNSSTVSGNSSGNDGGGIYVLDGNIALHSSTVSGNSSGAVGGGMYLEGGTVLIENSSVTNNLAATFGGGLGFEFVGNESLTISNSIIAGNNDNGTAPDFRAPGDPGSNLMVSYSLVGSNVGTLLTESQTPDTSGNLVGGSVGGVIDAMIAPLADNGGPTQTHALMPGSPALDAANSTSTTDQRGLTRPVDLTAVANAAGSNGSDMGAFELQGELPSLIVTTNLDVIDDTDFLTSLREAINVANQQAGADTITFDASLSGQTITLGGTQLESTGMLTIDANSLTDGVTIDANQQSRVLASTGEDSLTLRGLTLTGGSTTGGGGGLYVLFDAVLHDVVITGNSSGTVGGGMEAELGNVALFNSTVSGNSSGEDGGGITAEYGDVTLTNSTVSGNSSGNAGGGVYTEYGTVVLINSTVSANTAGSTGGGIHTLASVTLSSSTISGNSSSFYGGGLFADVGIIQIENSTVANNSAAGSGGGVGLRVDGAEGLNIVNSIIAGNSDNGTAPEFPAPANPSTNLTVSFSLIGNNQGTSLTEAQTADDNGNLIGGSIGGVIDPLLAPLADNGGPTQTHALMPGSLALDAGNSTSTTDQRGLPRPVDNPTLANAAGGNGSDIGAVEQQTEFPSLIVTTNSDVVDDTNFATSLREALIFANQQAGADTITFDASLSGGTITLGGTQLVSDDTLTIDAGALPDGVTIDANQQSRVIVNTGTDTLALRGLTITGGSTSGKGAGIYSLSGDVLMENATITGNSSGEGGGGIWTGQGDVTLDGSTISGNSVDGSGGGIYASSGNVEISRSSVSGNSVDRFGGGIVALSGDLAINDSTVSGNSSSVDAGGIFKLMGDALVENSTITNNYAARQGGGVFLYSYSTNAGESLTIRNSIIAGNTDDGTAPDFSAPGDPSANLTVSFSLIRSNLGTSLAEAQTADTNGNLIGGSVAGVIDPLLAPLADNGGPTHTHALLPGSPALDAGNSTSTMDQRGLARPVDLPTLANAAGGNGADMGAFEQQTELPSLIVTTNSDVVDDTDLVTSLREAIIFANDQAGGDTITFDASLSGGTITLGGTQLESAEMLTIDATSLPDGVTIDANQQSRVLVNGGADSLTLRGLTITGGSTDHNGAGIHSFYGDIVLEHTTITGNSSSGDGGGIWAFSGSVTLNSSTLSGNVAGRGGGLFSSYEGDVTINGSTVNGNTAEDGGGIWAFFADVVVDNSTISGNTSGFRGGGIYSFGSATLSSSTVSGNTSTIAGGGIFSYAETGAILIENSTVANNSTPGLGGGVWLWYGASDVSLSIANSIIAGNSDNGTAPDFSAPGDPGNNLNVSFSLIGSNIGTTLTEAQTADANGNLIGGSVGGVIDPLLGPLADNGGPTHTHALLPGSPALDAGNSMATTDQRGFARLADDPSIPNAIGGNGSDMGAFEKAESNSLVVTTPLDVTDPFDFVTSLREAISFANHQAGADTITFGANVFSGGSNSLIRLGQGELALSDDVTIDGLTGTDVMITGDALMNDPLISGTYLTDALNISYLEGADNSRVFRVTGGAANLVGLTITGGVAQGDNDANDGGGIRVDAGATLNLVTSTVTGNGTFANTGYYNAGNGGGIASYGTTEITDSTINGNVARGTYGGNGGGVYHRTGDTLTVTDSLIANNSGYSGGGIGNRGPLTVVRSTISDNVARAEAGGGIFAFVGDASITDSTVSGNLAGTNGGGIYSHFSVLSLTNTTVNGNSAYDGGGIFSSYGTSTLANSTISGNTANEGGGITANSLTLTINSSTITDNSAASSGGGISAFMRSGTLTNSIVAANTVAGAANDFGLSYSSLDGNYNLVGVGAIVAGTGNQSGVTNPGLAPLADNGGPTQTHALLPGSPAIDAGNSTLATDQRGLPRPFDFSVFPNASGGNASDIGAFELRLSDPFPLLVSTSSNLNDGNFTFDELSLREAIELANGRPGADTITFDGALSGQSVELAGAELQISETLTIDASALAGGWTIDGNNASRLLNFTSTVGDLELRGLNLRRGTARGDGGAILFESGGILTVYDSSISESTAEGHGGAFSSISGGIVLVNSTVSGNYAGDDGGGIRTLSGPVTIIHSTVTLNTADDDGGGISRLNAAAVSIHNSIIAGNLANGTDSDLDTTGMPNVSFSLIGDNTGTSLSAAPVGSPDANGNLIGTAAMPIDPLLAALADNGGRAPTHALLPGSPALNAGDPTAMAGQNGVPEFDQRGMGFDRVAGGRIDMGSFELQQTPCAVAGDLDCSGQVGASDLDLVLANWGVDSDTAGVPAGWVHDLPSGVIGADELDNVLSNWGNGAATAPAVVVNASPKATDDRDRMSGLFDDDEQQDAWVF